MKAKLIKKYGEFMLLKDNIIIASSDKNFNGDLYLSLSNCQAIEHGYDLKELANEYADVNGDYDEHYGHVGFKAGFQKALELIGHKKFSMRDMNTAFRTGHSLQTDINLKKKEYKPSGEFFKELIQSLQQTEWDVIVEMENTLENGYKNQPANTIGFVAEHKSVPKLDENGCLILKPLPKE
jgi:hypothetical protein